MPSVQTALSEVSLKDSELTLGVLATDTFQTSLGLLASIDSPVLRGQTLVFQSVSELTATVDVQGAVCCPFVHLVYSSSTGVQV